MKGRAVLAMIGIACMALAGCGKANSGGGGQSNSGSAGNGGGDTGTDNGGDTGNGTNANASQGSPGGAIQMVINAMARDKDPGAALAYIDPTCDLYTELQNADESIDLADEKGAAVGEMLRAGYALPWAGATYKILSEEDSRAVAVVTSKIRGEHQVDVIKTDGKWYLAAGPELGRPTAPGGG